MAFDCRDQGNRCYASERQLPPGYCSEALRQDQGRAESGHCPGREDGRGKTSKLGPGRLQNRPWHRGRARRRCQNPRLPLGKGNPHHVPRPGTTRARCHRRLPPPFFLLLLVIYAEISTTASSPQPGKLFEINLACSPSPLPQRAVSAVI